MRLRALVILALTVPGCGDEEEDIPAPAAAVDGPPSIVAPPPPAPGGSGPTLAYANGHPLDWLTQDPAVLSLEEEVVRATNDYRVSLDLDALVHDATIAQVARAHSRHMRADVHAFFDHQNPEGHGPSDRLTLNQIGWTLAGENIAAGQNSPSQAVTDWLNSPGHRANIERPGFRRIGVGYQEGLPGDPYLHYWTQMFTD